MMCKDQENINNYYIKNKLKNDQVFPGHKAPIQQSSSAVTIVLLEQPK